MVSRDPDTGIVSVPDWQLGAIVGVMTLVAFGLGGWGGTTLISLSGTVATHTEAIATLKDSLKDSNRMCADKLDKIYEELRKK